MSNIDKLQERTLSFEIRASTQIYERLLTYKTDLCTAGIYDYTVMESVIYLSAWYVCIWGGGGGGTWYLKLFVLDSSPTPPMKNNNLKYLSLEM